MSPLVFGAKPVADLDGAGATVRRFEPDKPREGIPDSQREHRVGRVGQHGGDHFAGLFHAVRRGHERKPAPEVFALRVYGREDVRDVVRTERA